MLRRHSQQVPISVLNKVIMEDTANDDNDNDEEEQYEKKETLKIQHLTG